MPITNMSGGLHWVDACDVLFINCYPFWEGCHIDYSLVYMKNMYFSVLQAARGKRVVISVDRMAKYGDCL